MNSEIGDSILSLTDPLPEIDGDWLLILGGVTRSGNRRARRFAALALELGHNVVWLDGFEEALDEDGMRVPLDTEAPRAGLTVIGYRDPEQRIILNRLANFFPKIIHGAGSYAATTLGVSSSEKVAHMGRQIRRATRRIGNELFSRVLNRIASMFRGYSGYRLTRKWFGHVAKISPPNAVVYCDEFALTMAWHLARQWPNTLVTKELPQL